MITLEEYKTYLINAYVYEIDNSKDNILKRTKELNKNYKDAYLNKIITDTYKLIGLINNEKNNDYYSINIDENNPHYISLNLTGGWFSDIIYEDINGNLISQYILKYFFGNKVIIEMKIEEYEFDTEDPDILSFDYEHYLYIQGFLSKKQDGKMLKKQKI